MTPWRPTPEQTRAGIAALEIEPSPASAPRKRRSKSERVLNPYEWEIQAATVLILRRLLVPGFVVHANVQERLGEGAGCKARQMGQIPGWPDLEIMGDGRTFLIEMKDRKGSLSKDQRAAHKQIREAGTPLMPICRSPEQAVTWLREQGCRFRGVLA